MPLAPLVAPGPPLSPDELARYARHLTLPGVGPEGQRRIRNAKVLLVGAGGLGAPILQYLVAAGLGELTVIDDDRVESSNLQRQVIHREADVGLTKVDSAVQAARRLDAGARITPIRGQLTPDNALELFAAHDLVIDGTDNFATRYLSNDAAELSGTPLVWGTIFQFSGQVSVFTPGHGPMLRDLFPEMPDADSVPSCAEGGVFGALCGVVGATMATEALKLICGVGEPLIGRLWCYDAAAAHTMTLELETDPDREPVRELGEYHQVCAAPPATVQELEVSELAAVQAGATVQLVDVRESWEREVVAIPGSIHVPLDRVLAEGWAALPDAPEGRVTVLVCKTGARSQRAASALLAADAQATVLNLAGGTLRWASEVRGKVLDY
ncbi:ThiF family adenylyltransferase [Glutamicibacter sp. PS]|uniref:ThiF family adenylyltransferase n=1 Tax=Glutamicibacter sp. PS TaxID=3075634 RepID=UPI00283DAB93|nr:ThiF family adenylyltransferase [Glutamicibacter sp. PS]MDR4532306.1 ThiF family adenylyltransferase [Glutamicibacter sp. PS]